jgi:glutathione S-transferase
MIELFHNPVSVSSQKIRLILAHKQVEWESRQVDLFSGEQHSEQFRQINPKGLVPALNHNGRILTESLVIAEYLEEVFPSPPLLSGDALTNHDIRQWTAEFAGRYHEACGTLSYAFAGRQALSAVPIDRLNQLIDAISCPESRERRRRIFELGLKSPEVPVALEMYTTMLDEMNGVLESSEFLVGHQVSLADYSAFPYIIRLEHLGMGELVEKRTRPYLHRWLEKIKASDEFEKAFSDFIPNSAVQGFQMFGKVAWEEAQEMGLVA